MHGSFRPGEHVDGGQLRNRFYAIESLPTVSGSLADHHFAVEERARFRRLLTNWRKLAVLRLRMPRRCAGLAEGGRTGSEEHKGRCVVIPGEFQPESVHLAAYAINAALGNMGKTVKVLEGVEPENTHSLEELTQRLE